MIITKFMLFQALVTGGSLTTNDVRFKTVTALEREDGTLQTFLVTGVDERGQKATVAVHTAD